MPNLTSGINIALQAILAQSQAIEITEHNVANASTPGYRRQSPVFVTSLPNAVNGLEPGIGAGQLGTGVLVERIQRFNLDYFDRRYRAVAGEATNWQMQQQILEQLEVTLAETSSDNLISKFDDYFAGWQSLAANPTSTSLRAMLLNQALGLTNALNSRAEQLNTLRISQDQVVAARADEINLLANEIANLNAEISRVLSVGSQPNDFLDRRDQALDRLSELTGAISYDQKNGEVLVAIGGHVLVTGHDAFKIQAYPDSGNQYLNSIRWEDGQAFTPPSGELKGLLKIRDEAIPAQQTALDQLAATLVTQINTAHHNGYDMTGNHGVDFFVGTNALDLRVNPALDIPGIAAAGAAGEPGNGEAASTIAAIKTRKVLSGGTATFGEYYNSRITGLGIDIQNARNSAYHNGLVLKALGEQRESVAGVSLDEEAANLVKYQRAYQAAARLMTVYDDMLDRIINGMGLVGR